ncbi:AT-hook motif nuclear-localized protein [Actinidia chinensis var. chinensis]|uniref:AT-hook motif nuclear-localized protein n=1 Tax=Actinidia chinensis var. chinensis TaxID=1590841 RepID=A0A2R6PFH1_ACTCC|nr:AT-hook motif nuclear-localized protein [Actinidia chinensis var. chinensis]
MADYATQISFSHTSEEDADPSPHSRRRMSFNSLPASGGKEIIVSSTPRKPRGRPPGSKNKPKPPVFLAGETDPAMKPAFLEIAPGADIIEAVVQFARESHVGVSVISGSGVVSNVTLRHPASHAPSLTLDGPFNILSLNGTFLSQLASLSTSCGSFGISLAGQQGQVFGGVVGGKVTASGKVMVVAVTFKNPEFHRVSNVLEEAGENQQPNAKGGGGASGGCSTSSMSMSMSGYGVAAPMPLNCQGPHDVMTWGSTSRPS